MLHIAGVKDQMLTDVSRHVIILLFARRERHGDSIFNPALVYDWWVVGNV